MWASNAKNKMPIDYQFKVLRYISPASYNQAPSAMATNRMLAWLRFRGHALCTSSATPEDLWKLSGQRREPSWQLSSQESLIHFHKPRKKVPQINVEPLNSAWDTQLTGEEATATASPGGPLGPFADCLHPMPILSTPSIAH